MTSTLYRSAARERIIALWVARIFSIILNTMLMIVESIRHTSHEPGTFCRKAGLKPVVLRSEAIEYELERRLEFLLLFIIFLQAGIRARFEAVPTEILIGRKLGNTGGMPAAVTFVASGPQGRSRSLAFHAPDNRRFKKPKVSS